MKLLVSVIIPVFNGERFLAETLDSLVAQAYAPMEVLVVDDGSTDGTARIAQGYGDLVRYAYQPNRGQPWALNAGLAAMRGDVVGFVDADDLWAANKLALQLAPLREDPGTLAVIGRLQRFWDDAAGRRHFLPPERAMSLLAGLFRRRAFERVGAIDTSLSSHYDIDWYLRLEDLGERLLRIEEPVGFYRRHGANMSTTADAASANRAMLTLLRRSLRRRESNPAEPVGPPSAEPAPDA